MSNLKGRDRKSIPDHKPEKPDDPPDSASGTLQRRPGSPEHRFPPRGLRRVGAAWYVGAKPSKFDDWVARKIMPGPKKQDGVVLWDRHELDAAFDELPNRDGADENPYKD